MKKFLIACFIIVMALPFSIRNTKAVENNEKDYIIREIINNDDYFAFNVTEYGENLEIIFVNDTNQVIVEQKIYSKDQYRKAVELQAMDTNKKAFPYYLKGGIDVNTSLIELSLQNEASLFCIHCPIGGNPIPPKTGYTNVVSYASQYLGDVYIVDSAANIADIASELTSVTLFEPHLELFKTAIAIASYIVTIAADEYLNRRIDIDISKELRSHEVCPLAFQVKYTFNYDHGGDIKYDVEEFYSSKPY